LNTPREGDVLAGKYRVDRLLGRGAMGVVVAATHLQLGQRVALKFLLGRRTPDATARFLREARAAVRLRSEHVARVIDVGELETGAPYMVMEYLSGSDLKEVVESRGPLPVDEAVTYMLYACEAIAEAHAHGIIHRDLKPANLFLTRSTDGSSNVKVLDFGISKSVDNGLEGDGLALTKSTAILGSPLYMSPEQLNDAHSASPQSDIWSLGVILYQLLTGQVPFTATMFAELVLMINTTAPPPLSTLRADVPPGLEAAVLRCLQKDLSERFATVADFAWAIAPYGPTDAQASAEKSGRMLEAVGVRVKRAFNAQSFSSRPPAALPAADKQRVSSSSLAVLASSVAATSPRPRRAAVLIGGVFSVAALTATLMVVARRGPSHLPASSVAPSVAMEAPPPPAPAAVTAALSTAPGSSPEPSVAPASVALPPATTPALRRTAPTVFPGAGRASRPATPAKSEPKAPPSAVQESPLKMKLKD
jgi:serine/threonine-protein kinase